MKRVLGLSTAWKSSLSRRGREILDPVLRVAETGPIGGLVLDGGWSWHALAEMRPYFARQELSILAVRGPAGRPAPAPGDLDGSAPDAEVPQAPASPAQGLRARGGGRVWFGADAEAPRSSTAKPKPRRDRRPPRLCAPDADERAVALGDHLRAMELAAELEAPLITIGLGATDPEALPPLSYLGPWNRAFTEDERELVSRRRKRASPLEGPSFDGARFSLEALLRRAESLRVRVALENPPLPLALPGVEALHRLLAAFAGSPLQYAHDVSAARLCHALGGAPGREYLDAGRPHLALAYVSDTREREAWLPIGRGDLAIGGFAKATGDVPLVLTPRADWSERDVQASIEALAEAMG